MSSSHRSTSVPFSFDRFRVRTFQLCSSSCNRQREKSTKVSPERSRLRKIQVHPSNLKSSESKRIEHDATRLFHANKRSNLITSLSTAHSQDELSTKKFFSSEQAVHVAQAFDYSNTSNIQSSSSTIESNVSKSDCPPTPCMIHYRHTSIQNEIPIRIVRRPTLLEHTSKQVDLDCIDQINI